MTDKSPNEELALLGSQICVNNAGNTISFYSGVYVGNDVTVNTFITEDTLNVGGNTIVTPSGVYLKTVFANNAKGSNNQVLTTNSTGGVYWSSPGTASVNTAAAYIWANNHTFNANITASAIVANGVLGTSGQVLTTTGTGVYWSTPAASSVNTAAQYTWTNNHTFNANIVATKISAGGSTGSAGQILSSTGTGLQWITPAAVSVNTDAQYTWTNTQTFSNNITFSANIVATKISAGGSTGSAGQILSSTGTGILWINSNTIVNTSAQYTWTNSHTFIYGSNTLANVYFGNVSFKVYNYGTNTYSTVLGQAAYFTIGDISVFQPNNDISLEGASLTLGYRGQKPTYDVNNNPPRIGFWNIDVFGVNDSKTGEHYPDSLRFINYPSANISSPDSYKYNHVPFQILPSNGQVDISYCKIVMGKDWTPTENQADTQTFCPVNITGDIGPVKGFDSSLGNQVVPFRRLYLKQDINFVDYNGPNNVVSYNNIQSDYHHIYGALWANGIGRPVLSYWAYANSAAPADFESGTKGQAGSGLFSHMPLVIMDGIVPYGTNSKGKAGDVLTSDGRNVYWGASSSGSVNTAAQYTWTNTHTFNSTVNLNGAINTNVAININGNASAGNPVVRFNYPGKSNAILTYNSGLNSLNFYNESDFNKYVSFNLLTGEWSVSNNLVVNKGIVVSGSLGSAGQIMATTGSAAYWTTPGQYFPGTTASYTWTNSHTFNAVTVYNADTFVSNNKALIFRSGSSDVIFNHQTDRNFVITAGGSALLSFFSNTNTEKFRCWRRLELVTGSISIGYDGSTGAAGQVLTADGSGGCNWAAKAPAPTVEEHEALQEKVIDLENKLAVMEARLLALENNK